VDECGENDMESGTETHIHKSGCSQKLLENKRYYFSKPRKFIAITSI
jgi:hypothetical protein